MATDVGSAVGYLDLDISGFLAGLRSAQSEADTTYGKIGVKVWIYKGEILPNKKKGGNEHGVNTKKD